MMPLIPVTPLDPKPPRWTELQEATAAILDAEVAMEPEAFEAWLRERPGAAVLYIVLAQGDGLVHEIARRVLADLPVPQVQMPATLAELLDEHGRMPRWRDAPRVENLLSTAERQQRHMQQERMIAQLSPKHAILSDRP